MMKSEVSLRNSLTIFRPKDHYRIIKWIIRAGKAVYFGAPVRVIMDCRGSQLRVR
jgi:hypothetical protein